MIYINKVIILIIFLVLMYILLRKERKSIKFSIFIYFLLLSIVFMIGLIYISSTYQLNTLYGNPIDGGFNKLLDWVTVLMFFFLVPLFIVIGYKLFKLANKALEKTWVKIIALTSWLTVIAGILYLSTTIFVITFYGIGP